MRTRALCTTLATIVAFSVGSAAAAPPPHQQESAGQGRFDQPHHDFAPAGTHLREGTPESVGLAAGPIDSALARIARWTEPTPEHEHPMYGGAVSLLAHDGTIVRREAVGHELRYADGKGTELPPEKREPMRPNTLFDIASITKLFTSVLALQESERGELELDAPVATYLPEFGGHGKQDITVRQLLTHTSGLQAEVHLWQLPPEERIPAVMNLSPQHPPGSHYEYSDPNMITLGVLVSRLTGTPLDELMRQRITQPLGMSDTGYRPPATDMPRIAATEFQQDPPRGMVRGEVHDENAWSLGGVSGHAGLFSTADDLAVLGQALLNGGTYDGERILRPETVRSMLTDFNGRFPGNAHGLGFELDQRWYMAGLSGPHTAGHTGYTGTSLVLDPASRSVAVLMSNRVHPSREWGSNNEARQALAQGLAESLAVHPKRGPKSWFVPGADAGKLTTRELGPITGAAELTFDAFVDSQRDPDGIDPLTVQVSEDGGRHWKPVSLIATGRGAPVGKRAGLAGAGHRSWWRAWAMLPAGHGTSVQLRWRYTPDEQYTGRGVNLDDITVRDGARVLFDGERDAKDVRAEGWRQVPR